MCDFGLRAMGLGFVGLRFMSLEFGVFTRLLAPTRVSLSSLDFEKYSLV